MAEHSLWRFSRALQRAINERQFQDIALVIDDDIEWTAFGPTDMFPFLGARRGRDAVIDIVRQVADGFEIRRLDRETILLGIDSAASMVRLTLAARGSNKPISMRAAHFAQFKAGRLSRMRVLIDTFDLVEQVLGEPIHLPKASSVA